MSNPLSPELLELGVRYYPELGGATVALYCGAAAEGVRFLKFASPEDSVPSLEIPLKTVLPNYLPGASGNVWCDFVEGIRPGDLYGFRVFGPYSPKTGQRFNPNKVLLDPYAKVIGRQFRWHDALFGYRRRGGDDLMHDGEDSAPFAPLAMVYGDDDFPWEGDRPLNIPWEDSVIYEAHLKGQTNRHPGIPPELRGTYKGFASRPHIRHLKELGVTAVELMPVQKSPPQGLLYRNYWNYDAVAYMAPNRDFSTFRRPDLVCREFKQMVKQLHRAGIEVILDVVFNHTAEGNHLGPMLSLKGIDNGGYYLLCGDAENGEYRYYINHSGCGNTLNTGSPVALRLILDSLRWWVTEYHVDGFRFDLARIHCTFEDDDPFLTAVAQDPILSKVKLIAEPWDTRGVSRGQFPKPWREWNDRYRDTVRRFWRGDPGQVGTLASCLAGSRDLYGGSRSINFITCHDGFPLEDLVSYNEKHNETNGEENRDGSSDNLSFNYGCEGPTDDPNILAVRCQQVRNFISTLAFSLGTPMILAGDELRKTQLGNNNAYCHDNELTWLDWDGKDPQFLKFCRKLFRLRAEYSALRSLHRNGCPADQEHVLWFRQDGEEMTTAEWEDPERRSLGVWLLSHQGRSGAHCPLILLLNAHWENSAEFHFPGRHDFKAPNGAWLRLLDTSLENPFQPSAADNSYIVGPRTTALFRFQ